MDSLLEIGAGGYLISALAYGVLTLMLLRGWQGNRPGAMLLLAVFATLLWSLAGAWQALSISMAGAWVLGMLEILRDLAWIGFFFSILASLGGHVALPLRLLRWLAWGIAATVAALHLLPFVGISIVDPGLGFGTLVTGFMLISMIGLITIEQVYRNTGREQRWNIKFLCFALAGIFAIDFYLYTNAIFYWQMDNTVWVARGYIAAMMVPLIAVTAARNPEWSLNIHVSRNLVFHSAFLFAMGIYLVLVGTGSYLIKTLGGSWSQVANLVFIVSGLVLLLVMAGSGGLRARLKLFVSKNFFNYKYDYRKEWLSLTAALSTNELNESLRIRVIRALGNIVESPSGILLLNRPGRDFAVAESWNIATDNIPGVSGGLVSFLTENQCVVDLNRYRAGDNQYPQLDLPAWPAEDDKLWLLIPLYHQSDLAGIVVLGQPRASQEINWEDRDLLLAAGRQAAGYLALVDANEALIDSRQFDAFNRLSAFVVHDLKNVVAQMSLLVRNAEKHRHNPLFVDDMISTVSNATAKMDNMLAQLRKGRHQGQSGEGSSELVAVLKDVISRTASRSPVAELQTDEKELYVRGDHDSLAGIFEHMVQNAQDSITGEGSVTVRLATQDDFAVVEIEDTGCGMDREFIRNRLFRPFETTKGNAGMGIGVYETRELVHSLGGAVEVRSAPGEGSCFSLRIPLQASMEQQDYQVQKTAEGNIAS